MNIIISKKLNGINVFSTLGECFSFVNNTNYKGDIIVHDGIYKEKIYVSLKDVNIIGRKDDNVIFTYDDWAGKLDDYGNIIGTTNSTSFTLDEKSSNVHFENITFENSYSQSGKHNHSQAVAYKGLGDRIIYTNCRFLGFQDTLYLDEGRHLLNHCYIEGTVDFIFGGAVALFDKCIIKSIDRSGHPKGYITANRTNHNILKNKRPYGFVFDGCELISDIEEIKSELDKVFLGRPWRKHPIVYFINCRMGNHISQLGWTDMKQNSFLDASFLEYNNSGTGAFVSERRKEMSKHDYLLINFDSIFNNDSFSRKWVMK